MFIETLIKKTYTYIKNVYKKTFGKINLNILR